MLTTKLCLNRFSMDIYNSANITIIYTFCFTTSILLGTMEKAIKCHSSFLTMISNSDMFKQT